MEIASAPGAVVTCTARFLGRDGKPFDVEVIASDAGGEIGHAPHKRDRRCRDWAAARAANP